jgi:hypothetical protein
MPQNSQQLVAGTQHICLVITFWFVHSGHNQVENPR